MATFSLYKCPKCGYEVHTEPHGYYALMSGQYYNFKCGGCKNIVSISAQELAEMDYNPRCPQCNDGDHLSTWNPIDGKCPRCNVKMKRVQGVKIFAD
jgi:DNA-directed RNA polymerase subunit RPC12/RpoP